MIIIMIFLTYILDSKLLYMKKL